MKIAVISLGEKVTDSANSIVVYSLNSLLKEMLNFS
jgi:hypothetical protein